MATATDKPSVIDEAKGWLRNTPGAGVTAALMLRLVTYAERLERANEKASARVVELERAAGERR